MKTFLLAFVVAAPIAVLAAASNPDSTFYKHAAAGESPAFKWARSRSKKASSQRIKEFGAMMVTTRSAANLQLKSLAGGKNIDLPNSPTIGQMATETKLEVLSGDTFDKSYIQGMIKGHHQDIALFQKEAESGTRLRCQSLCGGNSADTADPVAEVAVNRDG